MSVRLPSGYSGRCETCYHWSPTEESDSFVVFRDGVEKKIIHGICGLKTSQPDSECTCTSWEEKVERLDDETVQLFSKMADDANEALIHFKTTNDRSKFTEWLEKYGDSLTGVKK
jgi:hypothetical protein